MTFRKFNLFNNIIGWMVFVVAAYTYLSTIEPTASLWDCGEFISGSYKLEVVHPPGNPFFLMFMHFFTMFSPNALWISKIVNSMSALSSAFCILFLYWTITLLSLKISFNKKIEDVPINKALAIYGSAIVGALAFNFSDSFWFSAVEGEVYALSAFFTTLVFWLLLKWDRRADEPYNLKWLILIFYMMGISIGVHLLSLLVLPVVAFVYYFRKTAKVTWKGIIISFIAGFLILGVVNIFVIRWFPLIASKFEQLFVNAFALPFWSGVLFTLILVFGLTGYFIYITHIKDKVFLNTALIGLLTIFIGYSSYTMVVIRSMANPPIDYSNPENVFNFISYVNREQYGDRPFLYGPQFTTKIIDNKAGRKIYIQDKVNHRYTDAGNKIIPVYDPEHKAYFPRMSDTRSDRAQAYRYWSGMRPSHTYPTSAQNMRFFFRYQLGHMYWRYFAWNFIGKQNDEQGHGFYIPGGFMYGNWISGIPFIDKKLVGNTSKMPYELRINKGYNRLYFLPFIFGLIGLIFHFIKNKRDAFSTLILFFITGILLTIYENSPPLEPRERDYTLIGSFYVFSIWIGLGVFAVINFLNSLLKKEYGFVPVAVFIASLFAVPVLMANQEWNDHDRSHKYMTRDDAVNYLNSCAPNSILFVSGDNETYPLWYCQEVEGIRTDIRVINLQLLSTDWNADQIRMKANNSAPIKLSLTQDKISGVNRDLIGYYNNPDLGIDPDKYYNIQDIVTYIGSDNPKVKVSISGGFTINSFPAKRIFIPVDKQKVLQNGTVGSEYSNRIVDSVKFTISRNSIYKNTLLVMDIISSVHWERPIYFSTSSVDDANLGLDDYLQQEGMTLRLVPVKRTKDEKMGNEPGRIEPLLMYENVINKFRWGHVTDPKTLIDNDTRRHLLMYRNIFINLAKSLLIMGDKDKVVRVLDLIQREVPEYQVPYKLSSVQIAELYFLAGSNNKAMVLANRLNNVFSENLDYFLSLQRKFIKMADDEIRRNYYGLTYLQTLAHRFGENEFYNKLSKEIAEYDKKLGDRKL